MIAKHVPMRSQAKSSFSGLAEYITDRQDKTQRVGQVTVTNCQALGLEASIFEIEATQLQNTRATSDKTFHLLVSFRQGENPSNESMVQIEKRICAALGYEDHQRVSAVHRDTDNLHIHIAINKINPATGNYHEPYQFHRTLGEVCQKLETDLGLERDNHETRKRGAEGRAQDMERHSGIESLITWVRRECLGSIQKAASWKELHQVMQEHGLELKRRGNGLVLMTEDGGVAVKPSTVARSISKTSLEIRLGPFQEADGSRAKDSESLIALARQECLGSIQKAASWKELHQVMQEHGLELKRRGNGLVLMTEDGGVAVKSSAVARSISKTSLEIRLGPFQEADGSRAKDSESLIALVRQDCLWSIRNAESWKEVHQVMREHGLEMQVREFDLVLTAGNGVEVRTDAVARSISMPSLEFRLGPFRDADGVLGPFRDVRLGQSREAGDADGRLPEFPSKRYEKSPRPLRVNTVELYAKYKNTQANLTRTRNDRLKAAMQVRDEAIKKARQAQQVRRLLTKLASDSATVRRTADRGTGRTLAKQDSAALRKELDAIQAEYNKTKAKLYASHQRQTWADWLRAEAVQGSAEALAALRSREAATGLRGPTVTGVDNGQQAGTFQARPVMPGVKPGVAAVGQKPPPQGQGRLRSLAQLGAMQIARVHAAIDSITKKGTIIYRGAGASAIRDDGQRLQVSREADQATVIQALRMASAQHGPMLKLEGSAEFKARAIRAAVDAGLAIKFSDPALEQRRLSLIEQEKERNHDNTQRPAASRLGADERTDLRPDDGGRRAGRGPGLVQQSGAANVNDAGRDSTTAVRGGGRGDTASKPNIGRVGRKPPPESQNRLRSLSQLGVVRVTSGAEVLLPRDVPRDVEQQGTKPDHALRRPVFGSGLTNAALAAADKYIAEREAKRAQGFDISKHIPYNSSSGELAFAGVRNIEGHTLVLLRQGAGPVIVAPVDAATAQRLSRLKIGDPVSITARGALRTTGRKNTL